MWQRNFSINFSHFHYFLAFFFFLKFPQNMVSIFFILAADTSANPSKVNTMLLPAELQMEKFIEGIENKPFQTRSPGYLDFVQRSTTCANGMA